VGGSLGAAPLTKKKTQSRLPQKKRQLFFSKEKLPLKKESCCSFQ